MLCAEILSTHIRSLPLPVSITATTLFSRGFILLTINNLFCGVGVTIVTVGAATSVSAAAGAVISADSVIGVDGITSCGIDDDSSMAFVTSSHPFFGCRARSVCCIAVCTLICIACTDSSSSVVD